MSFMKQLEEYKEFSGSRADRSRSHSSGRSDERSDDRKKRKHDHSRRRSRSRSSSNSRDRSPRRRRSRSSEESTDDEAVMERSISDKPTPVILARGITEYMNESILRDAIITSGTYPRDVHIARKRRSGHVRGWAFVEFYNEEDARHWLESYQGTFYMGEDRLSLLFCVPSESPFYGDTARSEDWNCVRCGKFNTWRDHNICYRCGNRRDDGTADRRNRGTVETPNFDRIGRSPVNTILIRDLDTATISERTIKAALYEQQRIASSSIRSCFITRNPPLTETTKSTSCCYAFIELSSTHEATQLIDRLESKPLVIDGKPVSVSFARYPFTTIMAKVHQWLASASETGNSEAAGAASYAPTQSDVTNAAAAVAQAAMMARQQAEIERAKRRAKRQARRERDNEAGETSRQRSSSASSRSSDGDDDSRSPPAPTQMSQMAIAAAAAAASSTVNQQYGLAPVGLSAGASFQFDTGSGYYYDGSTGSFFDPKTRYFYSPNLAQWLTWDSAANQYVPVPAQGGGAQEANVTNKQQLEGSASAVETDDMKKEREKREKAKEARRVQKEMEKWAANQNTDKGAGAVASSAPKRPQATPAANSQPSNGAKASTADAAFAFMQTSSSSSGVDQASLLESSVTHLMSLLDWQTFICKLCSRKLSTEDQLRKHCAQSELHKTNATRWCQDQGLASNMAVMVIDTVARALIGEEPAAPPAPVETTAKIEQHHSADSSYVYRDRAKERRQKSHGGSRRDYSESSSSSYAPVPSVSLDQPVSGLGQKLIEKMGWQEGRGLGRHGQGRIDPIEAERRSGRVGLGSSGATSRASTDHLDYREAAKRTLFSRFHELR